MRRLLVINPNTSASVSDLLTAHVQAAAGPLVAVRTVTARFGAPYISDEASYAVGAHAALDAWAAALAGTPAMSETSGISSMSGALKHPHQADERPDAVLIGCFGDPGLLALRESSPVPVTGLAEASFIEAARHGRFAIVTGGERWGPMLQRLAQALGQGPLLAGIHTVAPTGAQLAADPVAARALLSQACNEAARRFGVQTVILGGAGLAGMAAMIQPGLDVAVIDSVLAGTRWALRGDVALLQRGTPGFDVPWGGLSPELMALGLPRIEA